MREKHPIDDLFARVLRDAEVPPPPQVWQAIARNKGRGRNGRLRIGGWLSLVLLAGGSAVWLLADLHGGEMAGSASADSRYGMQQPVAVESPLLPPPEQVHEPGGNQEASPSVRGSTDEKNSGKKPKPVQEALLPGSPPPGTRHAAREAIVRTSDRTLDRQKLLAPLQTGFPQPAPGPSPDSMVTNGSSGSLIPPGWHAQAKTGTVGIPGGLSSATLPGSAGQPVLMTVRLPQVAPCTSPVPALPAHTVVRVPHRVWWVAGTAGLYSEGRTWKSDDAELAMALQNTEVMHPVTSFGMLVGRQSRGGWSLSSGVEYSATRFDFNHMDRFTTRQDSLVTFVVTFNSQVLSSYTDTVSILSDVQERVAAVNRVASLRLPFELGWHTSYRRFRFGARTGLAMELNTMKSGATLAFVNGGIRSERAEAAHNRRTLIVTGTLAADLGYTINECWVLWASPSYTTGLVAVAQANGHPFTLPQRMGVRIRLGYNFKPAR